MQRWSRTVPRLGACERATTTTTTTTVTSFCAGRPFSSGQYHVRHWSPALRGLNRSQQASQQLWYPTTAASYNAFSTVKSTGRHHLITDYQLAIRAKEAAAGGTPKPRKAWFRLERLQEKGISSPFGRVPTMLAATVEAAKRRLPEEPPEPKPHKRGKKPKMPEVGSVISADLDALLRAIDDKRAAEDAHLSPAEKELLDKKQQEDENADAALNKTEIDVEVLELSSTGDGLAVRKDSRSRRIYVVPFAVPGDVLRVRPFKSRDHRHAEADFVSVVKPSPLRDDTLIRCQYFGKCSGCQFQMMDYAEQLKHKKRIVERAFKNFSQLPPELIPAIGDTIGSPLQYGYRTKLTPHFDGPPGMPRKKSKRMPLAEMPDIGFMLKGRAKTLDIEDCPIGTDAVRAGMKAERQRMATEFGKYKAGATILLRETTSRLYKDGRHSGTAQELANIKGASKAIKIETEEYTDYKLCETDNNETTSEYIDNFVFFNKAGAFFQNNNSILPTFTQYIRENILPKGDTAPADAPAVAATEPPTTTNKIKNLVDAYSGSGLFTITLSDLFTGHATGIDIAESSITCARRNAKVNGRPLDQTNFIAADAGKLFKNLAPEVYNPDETVVVLDPPRKGCDVSFLKQLLEFGPTRIVYVSCNVHTQARDIGCLVRGEVNSMPGGAEMGEKDKALEDTDSVDGLAALSAANKIEKGPRVRYEIESLRGFDFFPQSAHVEGVAVLNRVVVPLSS